MDFTRVSGELTKIKKDTVSALNLLKEISRLQRSRLENLPELRDRLKELDKLSQKAEMLAFLQNWVEEYREELLHAAEDFKKWFGAKLERALKQKGFSLSGQYPQLKTDLFTIEPNFDRGRVTLWYGPKQERLIQCSLKTAEVANGIEKAQRQLGGHLSEEQYLQKLREVYSQITGDKWGKAVPIIDVLTKLAYFIQDARFHQDPRLDYYRNYGRADFSYDLFRLRQWALSAPADSRLHLVVATRTHTRNRKDFLWVPENKNGRGTTYSHLQFREITE